MRRAHRVRAWWKQYRWAREQRHIEAAEFCTYRAFGRWRRIKELNDISNVWRKRKWGLRP